jgi:hypothetical protein
VRPPSSADRTRSGEWTAAVRTILACRTGEIDPSFVISHRMSLEDAPKEQDDCTKVVLKP